MAKKVKAKENPADVEMITITVPKELPKGLEYCHGRPGREGWHITTKQGLKAFKEMVNLAYSLSNDFRHNYCNDETYLAIRRTQWVR